MIVQKTTWWQASDSAWHKTFFTTVIPLNLWLRILLQKLPTLGTHYKAIPTRNQPKTKDLLSAPTRGICTTLTDSLSIPAFYDRNDSYDSYLSEFGELLILQSQWRLSLLFQFLLQFPDLPLIIIYTPLLTNTLLIHPSCWRAYIRHCRCHVWDFRKKKHSLKT